VRDGVVNAYFNKIGGAAMVTTNMSESDNDFEFTDELLASVTDEMLDRAMPLVWQGPLTDPDEEGLREMLRRCYLVMNCGATSKSQP
jgi:hypothetical protein